MRVVMGSLDNCVHAKIWIFSDGNVLCVSVFVEVPAVVVGVVGMGHVPGIEKNWEKELNIQEIMRSVFVNKKITNTNNQM